MKGTVGGRKVKKQFQRSVKIILIMLAALLCIGQSAGAATKTGSKKTVKKVSGAQPKSIKLNKKSVTLRLGRSVTLKASISPSKAKKAKVTWSSNSSAVKVDQNGKVTALKPGKAVITAKTANGKKAKCKIICKRKGSKYTVSTPAGKQTYYIFNQNSYGSYCTCHGCVTTAVSIIASHYGKDYTPAEIHKASVKEKYGERYAVKKLGGATGLYGKAAISVRTASAILSNMGIKNKAVYTYSKENAIKEITAHLKKGKPVLVKVHNRSRNGLRLANGHHALVLVGVDSKGNGIFINPAGGKINRTHTNGRAFKISISTLVNYHMDSSTGNYEAPYVTSLSAANGYILVG